MKCDVFNDVKLFPTVYCRIYYYKFLNYPIRCHIRFKIAECIRIHFYNTLYSLINIVLLFFCLFMIPGPKFIKLKFILKLKIKRNDWLLADMCPQAANHCALF